MEHISQVYDRLIYIPDNLKGYMEDKKTLFFDIETTGLDPERSIIVLIGASYQDGENYVVEQYFAESTKEEGRILEEFSNLLKKFDTVVTYNGKNFDVPFINKRMEKCGINYKMEHNHLDMIDFVRPNKELLGLTSCSLKSVEKSLDILREDTIDGGESIKLYFDFVKTRDKSIRDKILLHNFEDVFNLPGVLGIFERVEYKEVINKLTSKQKSFLKSLLKRSGASLDRNVDTLTKQEASGLIDHLLNGAKCEFEDYIIR